MIRGRAHDRQAHRHVHTGVERQHLERDGTLVVVHRQMAAEALQRCGRESGVGRQRPINVDEQLFDLLFRRPDQAQFLVAKQAFFAGVWVQAQQRQARRTPANRGDRVRRQLRHFDDAFDGQRIGDGAQRLVAGDERAGDFVAVQQHRIIAAAREVGEQFGVAGKIVAGHVHCFFADRRGDHASETTGETAFDGLLDVAHRRAAADCLIDTGLDRIARERSGRIEDGGRLERRRRGVDLRRFEVQLQLGRHARQHIVVADDQRNRVARQILFRQQTQAQFRPHARRVAHRHRHNRPLHVSSFVAFYFSSTVT